MKQARRWLLLAAATRAAAAGPHTRKRRSPLRDYAGAAPARAAASPPPMSADADADPAGGRRRARGRTDSATPPPGLIRPEVPPAGYAGGGMDICQITPDAPQCQAAKEVNIGHRGAKADSRAEIYAVQQQYVIKGPALGDHAVFRVHAERPIREHDAPGSRSTTTSRRCSRSVLTETWYDGLNADSDFNFQNRRAARIAVPLNDLSIQRRPELHVRARCTGSSLDSATFIFHYDAYIDGGLGVIRTKPIPSSIRTTASSTGTPSSTSTSASGSASSSRGGSPPSRSA
jgi:hypothetical protein